MSSAFVSCYMREERGAGISEANVRRGGERGTTHVLSLVPRLDVPQEVLRARRELERELEPKQAIDVLHEVEQRRDLLLDLRRHAEHVRVVLHESAHARQAGERTRGFVSEEGRELAGCES